MTSIEREILQDLIDGNADVGPDGGIWYPSGPSDVSVSRLFAALVEKVRESERLLAASCEETSTLKLTMAMKKTPLGGKDHGRNENTHWGR